MTAPTQAAAPPVKKTDPGKAPAMLRPFKIGVQDIDEEPYDVTVTLGAGTQQLTPQYDVPATAFLNCSQNSARLCAPFGNSSN